MLLVPLPAVEELGCEAVVRTVTLPEDIEEVTLDADTEPCEDIEEENPVLGVDEAPPPELVVMVGADDTVCVVKSVSEVSEDPNKLYKEDDDEDTVGSRREDEPAELDPEFEVTIALDNNPGLLVLVLWLDLKLEEAITLDDNPGLLIIVLKL